MGAGTSSGFTELFERLANYSYIGRVNNAYTVGDR